MVHLLLRSIWVALVGLSYVYKNGVDIPRLKMGEPYNRLIFKDAQYTRNIVRLEEICSTTFAVSFLLFMLLLGGCFFLGVVVSLVAAWLYFFPDRSEQLTTIDPILSIIGGIYVLDFLTLGLFKRIPYFSKFYLPIYRVMSWLTLSPLYRKIYYGLVSNHAKWKSVLAILIFMGGTVLLYSGFRLESNPADAMTLRLPDSAEQLMYPGHYADRAGDKPSALIQIPSDVIERNVLSVFVVHRSAYEERYIKPSCNYDSRQDSIGHDTLVMDCLSRFYNLRLDGEPVEAEYLFTRKQKPYQVGLQTYLDITHLEKGLHYLELYYQSQEEGASVKSQQVAKVEFYKTQQAALIPAFTPELEE
jgi:hypothetical protein